MGDDQETLRALERLYRDKYPSFLRLALAILGQRDAAAEAVQEGFVRALRARGSLRDPERLEPWVWKTVLNVARAHRARPSSELFPAPEGEAGNDHAEEWPELRAAIAALPSRQREVLFLRHYADLDYQQIAGALGISRGTVAATLTQTHAALRRTLEVPR